VTLPKIPGILGTLGRSLLWSNVGGDATTWLDVAAILAGETFGPAIMPDQEPRGTGSMSIEPAGTYDLKHGSFQTYMGPNGANVIAQAGVHLKNLSMLRGTNLHFNGATLSYDGIAPGEFVVLLYLFGGSLQNDGVAPAIRIPDGNNPFIIAEILGGGTQGNNGPIFSLGPGGVLFSLSIVSAGGLCIKDGTVVSDDNTSLIAHGHTGGFSGFPNLPGFLGTQINVALTQNGGSGPTVARPVASLFPLIPGTIFYDTTLSKLIHWNGTAWVDYAETPV
jgi:hypothetical protein